MEKTLGLYIHIPFCERKCDYCNFVSYCTKDDEKREYVNNLIREIQMQGAKYRDYQVDSVFVGGGTPTCLGDGLLLMVLQAVYLNFKVVADAEITVECNPNSLTVAKLLELKKGQVNRLSIGLQAYNNKTLKKIGRLHNKKQFDECFQSARNFGFDNISVDIILGLPNQKLLDIKNELHHLVKLKVNHISAYGLILEEKTKLYKDVESGKTKLPSEEKCLKMYQFTKKYLKKYGYERYEVSNFAQKGCESKHNLKYWQNKEYLGLGAVSSSYIDSKRWKNVDDLKRYADAIKQNKIEIEEEEAIDSKAKIEECIMLGLRTSAGIDLQKLKQNCEYDLLEQKKKEIDLLLADGLIKLENNILSCTDRGFEVLNQVILQLV